MTDSGMRERILAQNNRKNGGDRNGGGVTEFKIGGFSAIAVLLDRQIEALEVVRLAIAKGRAEKSQYKVVKEPAEIKEKDLTGYSTSLTADKDILNYSVAGHGDFKSTLTKKWKVDVLLKNDKIISVQAVADESHTQVDKQNVAKKTYLNVDEAKLVVTVTKVESSNNIDLYELVATSEGSLNGSLDGNRNKGSLKSKLKFNFDGQELEQDLEKIKIAASNLEGFISFTPEKGKENMNTISSGNNVVMVDGFCSSVNGRVNFKSGPLQKDMLLDSENIAVEGMKYKISLAACGHRPAVDYSRLFVW